MSNEPTIVDLDETSGCEMTAEEQKAFGEKTVMYIENDQEAGMLRIAIPINALPSFTREQKIKMLTNCLADLIRKEF